MANARLGSTIGSAWQPGIAKLSKDQVSPYRSWGFRQASEEWACFGSQFLRLRENDSGREVADLRSAFVRRGPKLTERRLVVDPTST